MVQSAVDLLGFSVLPEQTTKHSLSPDPEDLCGHSALPSTSAFAGTCVVAFALGLEVKSGSGARMDFLSAFHDEAVFDEFANKNSGVGLSDLFYFIRVHPDAFLSAFQHLGCKSFLTLQAHHNHRLYLIFRK